MSLVSDFVRRIIDSVPLLILLACIWGVIIIVRGVTGFFSSRYSAQTETISTVMAVAEDQSLITSMAALDMLWLREKGRRGVWWSLPRLERPELFPDDRGNVNQPPIDIHTQLAGSVDGHCLHSYFVYYGYDRIAVDPQLSVETFPLPTIRAIHPVRSSGAPSSQLDECHRFNSQGNRARLEDDIENMLKVDRVLSLHRKQGVQAYAQILDALTGSCREQEESTPADEPTPPCFTARLPELYERVDRELAPPEGLSESQQELQSLQADPAALVTALSRGGGAFASADAVLDPGIVDSARDLPVSDLAVIDDSVTAALSGDVDADFGDFENLETQAGEFSLTELFEAERALRVYSDLAEDQAQSELNAELLLHSQANLGAVRVTISTIDLSTAEIKRRFWLDSEGSYVQRDVMNILVGSPAGAVYPPAIPVLATVPVVRVSRPDIIAVDRYSTLNKRYGNENAWDKDPPDNDKENPGWTASVTRRIEASSWQAFARLHSDVVVAAENIIRQRVVAANAPRDVFVEFVDDAPAEFDLESVLRNVTRSEVAP